MAFSPGFWAVLLATHLAAHLACAQTASEATGPALAGAPASVAPPDLLALPKAQLKLALDDSRRQQRELVDLKLRLAAAESATAWLPWLLLGGVAMGGIAVWLGLRVRRLQRDQKRRDWAAAEAELHACVMSDTPTSSAAPMLSSEAHPVSSTGAYLTSMSGVEPLSSRTQSPSAAAKPALADAGRADRTLSPPPDTALRAVTVEELLDLDQQVDFFLVLGQEQAAIDLLLGHVRATGGINALPYLKLLEIYRQQGDEEAYERTRERFNQRFNAQAPALAGDLTAGRHLEDYPALVSRLQRAWPQPLRALAELEGLMLRRADLEALDLPAFHDLLTLHALVRDLPASVPLAGRAPATAPPVQTAQTAMSAMSAVAAMAERTMTMVNVRKLEFLDSGPVDVLLPLDGEAFDITQPRPRLAEPGSARAMVADWMQARSSVRAGEVTVDASWAAEPVQRPQRLDLDLTEHAPAPREFTRPGAFTGRDSRPSDFAAFDDSDLLPPSITRR